MLRGLIIGLGSIMVAGAACSAEQAAQQAAPVAQATANAEEGTPVATDFEDLCKITKGEHVDAPASGNRSTSSSNGTTISVLGSRSQSISSVNRKAVITVTGAAVLHLTFPNGDLASVETNASADRVAITIDGPDAISCKAVS